MASFKEAIIEVFKNEGGYVDNPKDLGGTTNYGISLRFLQIIQKDSTKETIKNLNEEQAEDLYFQHFWLPNKYDQFKSQAIANKVFDTAVNVGSKQANRFLQRTLNIIIFNGKPLDEDGIMGKNTIEAINFLVEEDVDVSILKVYSLLQKEYYTTIVINRPNQIGFLKGWFNRAEN